MVLNCDIDRRTRGFIHAVVLAGLVGLTGVAQATAPAWRVDRSPNGHLCRITDAELPARSPTSQRGSKNFSSLAAACANVDAKRGSGNSCLYPSPWTYQTCAARAQTRLPSTPLLQMPLSSPSAGARAPNSLRLMTPFVASRPLVIYPDYCAAPGVDLNPAHNFPAVLRIVTRPDPPKADPLKPDPLKPHCSATLVGVRALLTAAHCVDAPASGNPSLLVVLANNGTQTLECKPPPQAYSDVPPDVRKSNCMADNTGCASDVVLCTPTDTKFNLAPSPAAVEAVQLDPNAAGKFAVIAGYGYDDSPAPRLCIGKLPFTLPKWIDEPAKAIKKQHLLAATEPAGAASAAADYGDSGGPVFDSTNPSSRRVIGVIHGFQGSQTLFVPLFRHSIAGYLRDRKLGVCGADLVKCARPPCSPGSDC